jgi:hypothetical protein
VSRATPAEEPRTGCYRNPAPPDLKSRHTGELGELRGLPAAAAVPVQRAGVPRTAEGGAPAGLQRARLLAHPLHRRRRPRARHPRRRPVLGVEELALSPR